MKHKNFAVLILIFFIFCWHGAIAQPAKENSMRGGHIIFIMLKMIKDSVTGKDSLFLVEKTIAAGQMKKSPYIEKLSRLPFLNFTFYKGNTPIDSMRLGYPLRERNQNTRDNVQGYKDIEIKSMEFFIRFQQTEADRLKIYKVSYNDKTELLTINLK